MPSTDVLYLRQTIQHPSIYGESVPAVEATHALNKLATIYRNNFRLAENKNERSYGVWNRIHDPGVHFEDVPNSSLHPVARGTSFRYVTVLLFARTLREL